MPPRKSELSDPSYAYGVPSRLFRPKWALKRTERSSTEVLLGFELTSCNDSDGQSIVISGTDSSASANKSALGETPKHSSSDIDIINKNTSGYLSSLLTLQDLIRISLVVATVIACLMLSLRLTNWLALLVLY